MSASYSGSKRAPARQEKLKKALLEKPEVRATEISAREFLRWALVNAFYRKPVWLSRFGDDDAVAESKRELKDTPSTSSFEDDTMELLSWLESKPGCAVSPVLSVRCIILRRTPA